MDKQTLPLGGWSGQDTLLKILWDGRFCAASFPGKHWRVWEKRSGSFCLGREEKRRDMLVDNTEKSSWKTLGAETKSEVTDGIGAVGKPHAED